MRVFFVALCATTLFSSVLMGDSGPRITETQFLSPLGEDHPALVALLQDADEAEAALLGSQVLANPDLEISREAVGELEQLDFAFSWQLPHPARRRLAKAAAAARLSAAQAMLEVDRNGLRLTMREAFARWAIATATVEGLSRWQVKLESLAQRERARAESGETSGLDARRLELAAAEVRTRKVHAEAARLEAFAAARAWRPDLTATLLPELPQLADAPPILPSHPLVSARRAELEAAMAERELAALVLDMPTLAFGWQRQDLDGQVEQGLTLGVRLALPLFNRRVEERAVAEARVEASAARLRTTELELNAATAGAQDAFRVLATAARETLSTSDATEAVVGAAMAAFAAGEATVTDLLDSLRAAAEAELAALELYREALAAQRRLERLLLASSLPAERP